MKHALVIDDNAPNLKVLAQLLARQGLKVTTIADSRTVATQLDSLEPFDVVFLDLEMPGVDGYAVKDLIRAHSSAPRIIACTVHVSEISAVKQLGFDGFIGKPLDLERFPDQLARILNGEAVWERV